MKTNILLFISRILAELIWALAVIAIEKRWIVTCLEIAFIFPFVQLIITCFTAVDKATWKERFIGTFSLALGGVVGMLISLWLAFVA